MLTFFFTPGAHETTMEKLMNGKGHIDYDNFMSSGNDDNIVPTASTFGYGLWLFKDVDEAKKWSCGQPIYKVNVDDSKYNVVSVPDYESKKNISAMLRNASEYDTKKQCDMLMVPRDNDYLADIVFEALMSCNGSKLKPFTDEQREKAITKKTEYVYNWIKALNEKDKDKIISEEYSLVFDMIMKNFTEHNKDITEDEVINKYSTDWGLHWAIIYDKKLIESLTFEKVEAE